MDQTVVTKRAVTPTAVAASAGISSAMPLTFTSQPRAEAAYRWADRPPYWGGAAIRRPVSGGYTYCSTGLAARTNSGSFAMITANHCGTFVEWRTPDNWILGETGAGYRLLDTNLIMGTGYQAAIYNGDYMSNTGVPIYGASNPALNSWVFASGSFSGASTVQVTQLNQMWNVTGIGTVGPGFVTLNRDGVASIGQGDSGGPAAQPASVPGGTGIYGRGILSAHTAGGFLGTCQGVQAPGRECSRQALFINITQIMLHFGLQIGNSGGA